MIETNKKIGDAINTKLSNRNIDLKTNLNNLPFVQMIPMERQ